MAGDTGTTLLPDIGTVSYNGVTFSALYKSNLSGNSVYDAANRTVKLVEWKLSVDGFVTLPDGQPTTDAAWTKLRKQLTYPGGVLIYQNKGFGPLVVNKDIKSKDVEWGPRPQILEFTPLGQSRSAFIRWVVTTRIPEQGYIGPLLQFNSDIALDYDEDGYSRVSTKGTLEIPLTRVLGNNSNKVFKSADDFRKRFLTLFGVDTLKRFRVVRRNFSLSRDRRTLEWEYALEELPPHSLPSGIPHARGTYSVRNMDPVSMIRWLCSMKCTYVVPKDQPRNVSYWAFMTLLHHRMVQSQKGLIPNLANNAAAGQQGDKGGGGIGVGGGLAAAVALAFFPKTVIVGGVAYLASRVWNAFTEEEEKLHPNDNGQLKMRAILQTIGFDEGLYLDSKTVTYEATWWLFTAQSHFMDASGIFTASPAEDASLWATSVQNIMGPQSWLENRLGPSLLADSEIIVDLGIDPK